MTSALRWAAMRAILMFLNCAGQSHKKASTDHNFWKEKRAEADSNRGPSVHHLFATRPTPAHANLDNVSSAKYPPEYTMLYGKTTLYLLYWSYPTMHYQKPLTLISLAARVRTWPRSKAGTWDQSAKAFLAVQTAASTACCPELLTARSFSPVNVAHHFSSIFWSSIK